MQGKYSNTVPFWMLFGHLAGNSLVLGSKAAIYWFDDESDIKLGRRAEDDRFSLKTKMKICVHFYWKMKMWKIQFFGILKDCTSKIVWDRGLWRYIYCFHLWQPSFYTQCNSDITIQEDYIPIYLQITVSAQPLSSQ